MNVENSNQYRLIYRFHNEDKIIKIVNEMKKQNKWKNEV